MKKLLYIIFIIVPVTLTAQNWTLVNSNTTDDIRYISFKDNTEGYFLTHMGRIYKTTDAGDNWTFIHQDTDFIDDIDPNYPTKEMSVVATNDSLFAFYNLNNSSVRIRSTISPISFTKDTLNHWMLNPKFWNNEIWDVSRVNQLLGGSFPNNNVVEEFAVSDNYIWATNAIKIHYSNDFGLTWQENQFTPPTLNSGPYQSFYNGTNNMVAVTQYPTSIYKTTNGINWTWHQPSETNQEVSGSYFYFVDHTNFLAYDLFGIVAKIHSSTDGGLTFNSEDLIDSPLGIYCRNNNNETIFIHGKNGMLYKSTNAGGLSVNSSELKKKIKIYPNPAKEKINIEYDDLSIQIIQLLDISGKIIRTYNSNYQEINIQGIGRGIYLLTVNTGNSNVITQKVIIE